VVKLTYEDEQMIWYAAGHLISSEKYPDDPNAAASAELAIETFEGVIGRHIAHALTEKQAEFDRMESAWRRECERLRGERPDSDRSPSVHVNKDYFYRLTAERDAFKQELDRLTGMLYEIGFCPCGSTMPCIECGAGA
jgi:hypothetical protein